MPLLRSKTCQEIPTQEARTAAAKRRVSSQGKNDVRKGFEVQRLIHWNDHGSKIQGDPISSEHKLLEVV